MKKRDLFPFTTLILIGLLIAACFGSFFIGRYPITGREVIDILFAPISGIESYWDKNMWRVVTQIRLPRIIVAIMVGGALSVSGACYQTMFKNPMASPDLLGVSAGAGFGAALAMVNGAGGAEIQASAFCFGLLAVGATYMIGRMIGKQSLTVLILAGVVVGSLFQALLSIIKTLADVEDALPSITFWLMGSLGKSSLDDLMTLFPIVLTALAALFFFRHQIDALAAGENEALTLGVNVPVIKTVVIVCATMLTVASVSICGIIGWIGMVVPHIARAFAGARFPRLSLLSFLIGGVFLLMVDNVVRGVEHVDLPIGVLTSLIGTPIFVVLLARTKKGWH